MSDYIIRENQELGLLIETKQRQIRAEIVEQYIACRKEKKMTQADIADALGVKRPNITRFENGTYNPTLDMLVKIAECMGKDLEIRLVDKEGQDEEENMENDIEIAVGSARGRTIRMIKTRDI